MKTSNHILQIALSVTLGLVLALGATTADAGKRDGVKGKRDVIADATPICDGYAEVDDLALACALFADSDGWRSGAARGCTEDTEGDAKVYYSGRNCDSNENSLRRYAASSVLSLDDAANGKTSQEQTAAGYLCGYADKYDALVGAGKLAPVVDGVDLGEDARDIVYSLGLSCDI